MGLIKLDLETYYWMLERAGIDDDERNKVDEETSSITLHREVASKLYNGVHVAALMINMRKEYVIKTNRRFTLGHEIY
jgi:hypothetical protein